MKATKDSAIINVGAVAARVLILAGKHLAAAYNTFHDATAAAIERHDKSISRLQQQFDKAIDIALAVIMKGFPEGERTKDTAAKTIYLARRKAVIGAMSLSKEDKKVVDNRLDYRLRKVYGGAPVSDNEAQTESAKRKKTADANRLFKKNAATKIKKANPKLSDEAIEAQAAAKLTEYREQQAANDKCERLAAWVEREVVRRVKEVCEGDTAEIEKRIAAVAAAIRADKVAQ